MTIRAFVIGHPIAHSRSPLIHNAWLADYQIDGSYEAIDIAPPALPGFFERLRAGEFAGGNVTIPHKEAVFALCDEVDPLAFRIGAVNTLIAKNGRVTGTNTDYHGFLASLDNEAPGWSDGHEPAIVIGAGGAARAIIVALQARNIPVLLLNRTRDNADQLAREVGGDIRPAALDAFNTLAPGAGLVVNTSAVGMHGTGFTGFNLDLLRPGTLVTDIVYTPLVTPLLAAASARGLPIVDGLGMLLHQAVPGFAAWFGLTPIVTPGLRARIEASLGV